MGSGSVPGVRSSSDDERPGDAKPWLHKRGALLRENDDLRGEGEVDDFGLPVHGLFGRAICLEGRRPGSFVGSFSQPVPAAGSSSCPLEGPQASEMDASGVRVTLATTESPDGVWRGDSTSAVRVQATLLRQCEYQPCSAELNCEQKGGHFLIGPRTKAGGRNWITLQGMRLCRKCYNRFIERGSLHYKNGVAQQKRSPVNASGTSLQKGPCAVAQIARSTHNSEPSAFAPAVIQGEVTHPHGLE